MKFIFLESLICLSSPHYAMKINIELFKELKRRGHDVIHRPLNFSNSLALQDLTLFRESVKHCYERDVVYVGNIISTVGAVINNCRTVITPHLEPYTWVKYRIPNLEEIVMKYAYKRPCHLNLEIRKICEQLLDLSYNSNVLYLRYFPQQILNARPAYLPKNIKRTRINMSEKNRDKILIDYGGCNKINDTIVNYIYRNVRALFPKHDIIIKGYARKMRHRKYIGYLPREEYEKLLDRTYMYICFSLEESLGKRLYDATSRTLVVTLYRPYMYLTNTTLDRLEKLLEIDWKTEREKELYDIEDVSIEETAEEIENFFRR